VTTAEPLGLRPQPSIGDSRTNDLGARVKQRKSDMYGPRLRKLLLFSMTSFAALGQAGAAAAACPSGPIPPCKPVAVTRSVGALTFPCAYKSPICRNARGPRGRQGPTGTGADGPAGGTGVTGADGPAGPHNPSAPSPVASLGSLIAALPGWVRRARRTLERRDARPPDLCQGSGRLAGPDHPRHPLNGNAACFGPESVWRRRKSTCRSRSSTSGSTNGSMVG
jgi:hypothetical protein